MGHQTEHRTPILITLFFIICEALIVIELVLTYVRFGKPAVSPREFNRCLDREEGPETVPSWIALLRQTLGRRESVETIHAILTDALYPGRDRLELLTNLGPAVGLMSTFLGMIVVLARLSATESVQIEQIDQVVTTVSGLHPVFIGSLAGMFVYALGSFFQSRAYSMMERNVLHYLRIYLAHDDRITPLDMTSLYRRLLEPVEKLRKKLDKVNEGFESFIAYTGTFESKTKAMTAQIGGSLDTMMRPVASLVENIRTHHEDISGLSTDIKGYVGEIHAISSHFEPLAESFTSATSAFDTVKPVVPQLLESCHAISRVMENVAVQNRELQKLITSTDNCSISIQQYVEILKTLNIHLKESDRQFDILLSDLSRAIRNIQQPDYHEVVDGITELRTGLDRSIRDIPPVDLNGIVDGVTALRTDVEHLSSGLQSAADRLRAGTAGGMVTASDQTLQEQALRTALETNTLLKQMSRTLLFIERRINRPSLTRRFSGFLFRLLRALFPGHGYTE